MCHKLDFWCNLEASSQKVRCVVEACQKCVTKGTTVEKYAAV